MNIGFIGLGAMGSAMARRLIAAGHNVTLWNRSPEPAQALAGSGARTVGTAMEAMRGEVVLSMLANDEAVRAVFLEGDTLGRLSSSLIHVNLATISVALAKELTAAHAARGIGYLATPVFGRPDVAASGQLNIVAGGNPAVLARVQPLLDTIGQKTWPVGTEPFQANLVKISGNLMIAAAIEAMAEATALGRAHGIDANAMLDIYTNTLFACRAYQSYAPGIAAQRFEPAGFKLRLGLKDVRLALEAGDAANVPLPFGSALRDAFLDAMAAGDGDKDWSAISAGSLRRAHLSRT